MTYEPHANKWEDDISAITTQHDIVSNLIVTSVGLETAGAANTAAAIVNIGKYSENVLYIDSTGGPAANAGTTGLTVFLQTRPASAIPWFTFRTESGVEVSGLSAIKIVGSGVASVSGITTFGDIKITIENTTDSSGTATVQAWLQSRVL